MLGESSSSSNSSKAHVDSDSEDLLASLDEALLQQGAGEYHGSDDGCVEDGDAEGAFATAGACSDAEHDDLFGDMGAGLVLERNADVAMAAAPPDLAPGSSGDVALVAASGASRVAPPQGLPPQPRSPLLHFVFENGAQIRAFPNIQKFKGLCPNSLHGRCVLTRTWAPANAGAKVRNPFQGRPLGLLAFFCESCDTLQGHTSHLCAPTLEQRKDARQRLRAQPAADFLFSFEREKAEGEDTEPDMLL